MKPVHMGVAVRYVSNDIRSDIGEVAKIIIRHGRDVYEIEVGGQGGLLLRSQTMSKPQLTIRPESANSVRFVSEKVEVQK